MSFRTILISLTFLVSLLCGCSSESSDAKKDELLRFAEANFFFWYFKSQGYDTSELAKITSGIVEVGSYSADKFQQIALLVKDYKIGTETKQSIDQDLLKCFVIENDEVFLKSLNDIRQS